MDEDIADVEQQYPRLREQKSMVGFLADSGKDGIGRLYLNRSLSDYVEFSEDVLLHVELQAGATSSLPLAKVWIGNRARLRHVREVEADFLSGDVVEGFLSDAPAAELANGIEPQVTPVITFTLRICVPVFTRVACTKTQVCNPTVPCTAIC